MEHYQFGQEKQLAVISALIDKENHEARSVRDLVRNAQIVKAQQASSISETPLGQINELFQIGNLPVSFKLSRDGQILAYHRDESRSFSIAQMSDGERSAAIIAATVLTVDPGTMLLIDEPERHLHRSIIEPFLSALFARREDCSFILSTHEVNLPLSSKESRILVIHSCEWDGQQAKTWDVNLLEDTAHLSEDLKRAILGSRARILFVEGDETSLDKSIYSLIVPMVSVIPKGNRREVEQAVSELRDSEGLHWLEVFGIVDGDGLTSNERALKREKGIYALPYYSVEAIYFHPNIVKMISARQAELSGGDATKLAADAIAAGIVAMEDHTERLSQKVTKKIPRNRVVEKIPSDDDLLKGVEVKIVNDALSILEERKSELEAAVRAGNWEEILKACPVRDSGALAAISTKLQFRKIENYQRAVRKLVNDDLDAVALVREWFDDLPSQLNDNKVPRWPAGA